MRTRAGASAERCGDIWASERLPKGKTINIFPINCLILSPESTRKCFLRPCACARSLRWSLVTKRTELYAAICVRRFLGVVVVRISLNCYFSRVSELIVAMFFLVLFVVENRVPRKFNGTYPITLHTHLYKGFAITHSH